jgi:hypothetical protein
VEGIPCYLQARNRASAVRGRVERYHRCRAALLHKRASEGAALDSHKWLGRRQSCPHVLTDCWADGILGQWRRKVVAARASSRVAETNTDCQFTQRGRRIPEAIVLACPRLGGVEHRRDATDFDRRNRQNLNRISGLLGFSSRPSHFTRSD